MFAENLVHKVLLGGIGLSAGSVIAAGVFAFLAIIGVYPRLIGKTKTRHRILLYETMIVAGGTLGNLLDVYQISIPMGIFSGVFLGIAGLSVGIFVGSLVMSLAETLQALPVMNRRIHLAVGFQYVVFAIALGKLTGALLYFSRGMEAGR